MVDMDWTAIDVHARQASIDDARSFVSLVAYLERAPRDSASRDLCLVRALISWMHSNQNPGQPADDAPSDNPLQLMSKLHKGRLSHAEAFHILCTQAGLDNKVVTGISKSGSYRPGDIDASKLAASWNIVRIDAELRLLYPRWIIRTAATPPAGSHDPGTESRDAQSMETTTAAKTAVQIPSKLNEFWFLTNPEHFIYKCFPDEMDMQLLPPDKQISRQKQFMLLPALTPTFFRNELTLVSDNRCLLYSENGVCKVEFKCERIQAKHLELIYELQLLRSNDENVELPNLNRLMFSSRVKGKYSCEVRCPTEGEYRLAVRGGHVESELRNLCCQFKIICRERVEDIGHLPLDAGTIAWGFGRYAEKAGLMKSSVKDPKLSVRINEEMDEGMDTKIRFDIDPKADNMNYRAELFSSEHDGDEHLKLQDWVKVERDDDANQLVIDVGAPSKGEFTLQIQAADMAGAGKPFTPIANFLLLTDTEPDAIAEEYVDSSDGMTDLDDEIEKLELMKQRIKKQLMKRKTRN